MFRQHSTISLITRVALAAIASLAIIVPSSGATTVRLHSLTQARASVIGGYQPTVGIWPWMTALTSNPRTHQGSDFDRQFCGATLIAPRLVLTAAHCVTEEDGSLTRADAIQAVLGKQVLSAAGGEHLDVTRIVRHPQWNRTTLEHDLALVSLASASSMLPAQLIGAGSSVSIGTMLTAMGWGQTSIGADQRVFADALKAVDMPLWSDQDCDAADATWAGAGSYHPATMLCAGYTQYIDATCKGDSGGPLMLRDSAGIWRLFGVVSWGKPDCDRMGRPSNFAWLGADDMRAFVVQGIAQAAQAPAATPAPVSAPAPAAPASAPIRPRVVSAPGGQQQADAVAPVLGAPTVNPRRVRVGRTFRLHFTTSEAAKVSVRISGPHHQSGSGSAYVQAGSAVLRLPARLDRTLMRRGAWRVSLRLTDGAGNSSARRAVRFRVVR